MHEFDVAIVGGGIAGLTAAHAISSRGLSVVILERSSVVGGRMASTTVAEQVVDTGAAFISDFYSNTMKLIEDLDLSDSLVRRTQVASIVRENQARPIWPANELAKSNSLSLIGKARLLALLPALAVTWPILDIEDLQSVRSIDKVDMATLSRYLVGNEASEFFIEPLLRGLLYWDAQTTSAAIVLTILKSFASSKATYRVNGGARALPESLAAKMNVVNSADVIGIARDSKGACQVSYVEDGVARTVSAGGAVLAVRAPEAATLAGWLANDSMKFLQSISYSSTAALTFSVSPEATNYPTGATLFSARAVPELSSVNPLYHYSSLDADSSRRKLLNIFVSSDGYHAIENMSNEQVQDFVVQRLRTSGGRFGWVDSAELENVARWPMALPRFGVHHMDRVSDFHAATGNDGQIAFAGDYIGGPFIDGAVRSGLAAASHLISRL